MRHITVSVLAFIITLPAFADARLPVVNLASGGVSARAAFGESVATAPSQKQLPHKKVVARPAVKKVVKTSVDTGEKIIASNDVLIPHRPSNDLWARNTNDAPLRMPDVSEFAVYRTEELLPEESLDASSMPKTYAYNDTPVSVVTTRDEKKSELDAQIARLVELQRRADESVRPTNVASRVIARPIAEETVAMPSKKTEPVVAHNDTGAASVETVNVRRMVVPMETRDVIVRTVEKMNHHALRRCAMI